MLRTNDQGVYPQSVEGERGVIGCLLQGATDACLRPDLFIHDGRRSLFHVLQEMIRYGELIAVPDDPTINLAPYARANAQLVLHRLNELNAWPFPESPPDHELTECLAVATLPELLDFHVDQLIEAEQRRRLQETGEKLLRFSQDESADLPACIGALELESLLAPADTTAWGPVLVCLADIESKPVDWLWPGMLARGKLTMIAGDPGLGKSMITMDLAARLSVGGVWPDGSEVGPASGVVLLTAEDAADDTLRPRLDAAGADVHRIQMLQAVRDHRRGRKSRRMFSLTTDLEHLDRAISRTADCAAVIIDPISAYLGGTDSHNNSEVRNILAQLNQLAEQHNVAMILVTHLNKSEGLAAIHRTMGSVAFVAAVRVQMLVIKDPEDPQSRLFMRNKNNIGKDVGGYRYQIKEDACQRAYVEWSADPVTVSVEELINQADKSDGKLKQACDWLREQLSAGPVPSKSLMQKAKEDGIATRTLRRAAGVLGITKVKEGFGEDGGWIWSLGSS